MLVNYAQANPDKAFAPSAPQRRVNKPGGGAHYMTDAEYAKFSEDAGKLALQFITRLPLNVDKPTDDDIERVKRAFSTARVQVRRRMFPAYLATD